MTERYMPIGIQDFEKIRTGQCAYVDKTTWVYRMTRTKSSYLLGRPRRFGKSLLVSTLKYYFEGRRDLFDGSGGGEPLAIAALEKDWKKHPALQAAMMLRRAGIVRNKNLSPAYKYINIF